ncbi:hypothetical protein Vadar_016941 [Vaccinium darrowii]|uniref:Uncharacterized protein n=1 Tax=Vaccinium darrowii TaxID=229202 RepID=A0ACB7XZH7_9ERIC|nr:hypothetical protein Vadar_016941 [Vaccinium darrowii]
MILAGKKDKEIELYAAEKNKTGVAAVVSSLIVTPHLSLGGEVFWASPYWKSGIGYAARYNTDKMGWYVFNTIMFNENGQQMRYALPNPDEHSEVWNSGATIVMKKFQLHQNLTDSIEAMVIAEVAQQYYGITGADIETTAMDGSLPMPLLHKLSQPKDCRIHLKAEMNDYSGINQCKFIVQWSTSLPADILAVKNIPAMLTKSSLGVELDWMSAYLSSMCTRERETYRLWGRKSDSPWKSSDRFAYQSISRLSKLTNQQPTTKIIV